MNVSIATLGMCAVVALAPLRAQTPAPGASNRTITAVPGIKVGHHTLAERPTGCTVILVDGEGAVGDIIDPDTGQVVAGVRNPDGSLADARTLLRTGRTGPRPRAAENTTIGLVATNARLTKSQAHRMALMADDGLARAIFPAHTQGDGDTVFSLATGQWTGEVDITQIGALAADVMARAIVRGATAATGLPKIPAVRDLKKK